MASYLIPHPLHANFSPLSIHVLPLRCAPTYEPCVGEEAGAVVPVFAAVGRRFRRFAVVLKLRQARPTETPGTRLAGNMIHVSYDVKKFADSFFFFYTFFKTWSFN